MLNRVWERRAAYQLFSGVLFIALGVIIFIRGNGLRYFLNIGLLGLLFVAYGVYRLNMFAKMRRQARESRS